MTPDADAFSRETIFTVGHSTLSIDAFIGMLDAFGIQHLVDIRTVPRSRHNPQFNGLDLRESLAGAGIAYTLLPGLGGLRRARPDSNNTGWRNESFRGYADYMQTAAFDAALQDLMRLAASQRVAIMCAEAVPWRCHRSLVADALVAQHLPVIEIMPGSSYREHKLTPFARITGTAVTYPPQQPGLFRAPP